MDTLVSSDRLDEVFNSDVADLLKQMPNGSVDCIFADPDYNVGIRYNNKSYKRKFDEYIAWLGGLCVEFHRVLSQDGNFFIINYPKLTIQRIIPTCAFASLMSYS